MEWKKEEDEEEDEEEQEEEEEEEEEERKNNSFVGESSTPEKEFSFFMIFGIWQPGSVRGR